MSNRRKSARLSIKTTSSSSTLVDTKSSLVDCSPSSSVSDLTPLLVSPKSSSKSSKLNKTQQQQIKNAVKKSSPRAVISTILNSAEINQLKLPTGKVATKRAVATSKSQKKVNSTSKLKKTLPPKKASNTPRKKKANRQCEKEKHSVAPLNRNASILVSGEATVGTSTVASVTVSTLPVTTALTPLSPNMLFSMNNQDQSTPTRSSPNLLSTSLLHAVAATNTSTFVHTTISSPLSNFNSLSRAQSLAIETNASNTSVASLQSSANQISDITITVHELKFQLKKATIKFEKACRQLIMLDQHINDLQNSYSNSLENDRKTFKIVYRMQLATLEGTHNAYIEYIERQVEKIKKLKRMLFNENANQHLNNSFNAIAAVISSSSSASTASVNTSTSTSSNTPS